MKDFRPIAILALVALVLAGSARAQTVAVAANAKGVAAELTAAFESGGAAHVKVVVASSGVLAAQVRSGAPFDLFLSADTSYPSALWREVAICG